MISSKIIVTPFYLSTSSCKLQKEWIVLSWSVSRTSIRYCVNFQGTFMVTALLIFTPRTSKHTRRHVIYIYIRRMGLWCNFSLLMTLWNFVKAGNLMSLSSLIFFFSDVNLFPFHCHRMLLCTIVVGWEDNASHLSFLSLYANCNLTFGVDNSHIRCIVWYCYVLLTADDGVCLDSQDVFDGSYTLHGHKLSSPSRHSELIEIVEFPQLNVRTIAEQLTRIDSVSSVSSIVKNVYQWSHHSNCLLHLDEFQFLIDSSFSYMVVPETIVCRPKILS